MRNTLHTWVLLHYKIPPKPTRARVYVWRKLKRLGAVLLHDAVWVLPANPRTVENLQWLAMEIGEAAGEAMVWHGQLTLAGQDEALVSQFESQVDAVYTEILEELDGMTVDLTALGRRYQQAQAQDYFGSELGARLRAELLCRGARDD